MVTIGVSDCQNDHRHFTGHDHRAPVCDGVGDGLFYENMLARRCRRQSAWQMYGIGGWQDNTVEIVKRKHVFLERHGFSVEGFGKLCVLVR